MVRILSTISFLCLTGCTQLTYKDYSDNICKVIDSHYTWKSSLVRAQDAYGISPGLVLSVILHESSFKAKARPPAEKYLGFISWQSATAYGYAQVKNETWKWYKSHNPGPFQSRTSFVDSVNFIGWYYKVFQQRLVKESYTQESTDADFYLAYHEGMGGFVRKTYLQKQWLMTKAGKVSELTNSYNKQLLKCL